MSSLLLAAAFSGYLVGCFLFFAYLALRRPAWAGWGMVAVAVALALHTVSYGQDCATTRAMVIATPRGSFSLLGYVTVFVFMAIALGQRLFILGAFVMPFATVITGVAVSATVNACPAPFLHGAVFPLHIVTAYLGFALFAATFGIAIAYLIQERQLKSRRPGAVAYILPPLDVLDRLGASLAWIAVAFMAVGMLSGRMFSRETEVARWMWKPKIAGTVAVWALYAGTLSMRVLAGWRGKRIAVILIVLFALALFVFAGISHVSTGVTPSVPVPATAMP